MQIYHKTAIAVVQVAVKMPHRWYNLVTSKFIFNFNALCFSVGKVSEKIAIISSMCHIADISSCVLINGQQKCRHD
jgi:hypothetical protein